MSEVAPRWEIGSGFDWHDGLIADPAEAAPLPANHVLFATGTGSLLALARGRDRRVLHLPSYFCMEVAARLRAAFDLAWYRDLPTAGHPDFGSLRPAPGDWVLAVNLFGTRTGIAWDEWLGRHDDVTLIEDHTHDPFSSWARRSTAHYAVASLRKTLPLPDGALLWSPRRLPVPVPSGPAPVAAGDQLSAMILKRAFLQGADVEREAYRALQLRAECALQAEAEAVASAFTRHVLGHLPIERFRERRRANVRQFVRRMSHHGFDGWEPLFSTWPDAAVPYNGVLLCRDECMREQLRRHLVSQRVFCPVHWSQPDGGPSSGDAVALDLSRRVLTVPIDQRYSSEDVRRVVEIIAALARRQQGHGDR